MYKEILFTHDDLDGAGCRIVYTIAHQDKSDWTVVNCHNTTIDDDVNKVIDNGEIDGSTVVTFADIVASREVLENLKKMGCRIWIFDHHRSNVFVDQIIDANHCFVMPDDLADKKECGTSIMFKKYVESDYDNDRTSTLSDPVYGEMIGSFVDVVRSYDTWEWKTTNNLLAKRLNTLMYMLGMDNFCDMYVKKLTNANDATLIDEYADMFIDAKLSAEQNAIDAFDRDCVVDITTTKHHIAFAFDTAGMAVSELASQFLAKYPEYDMFIGFNMRGNGQFSLRTIKDDVDVSEYAQIMGGGGHPQASGAPLSYDALKQIIGILVDQLPEKE